MQVASSPALLVPQLIALGEGSGGGGAWPSPAQRRPSLCVLTPAREPVAFQARGVDGWGEGPAGLSDLG